MKLENFEPRKNDLLDRWLLFLKNNVEYIKIGKQIEQIRSEADIKPSGHKLRKNYRKSNEGIDLEMLRDAIITSFNSKQYDDKYGAEYKSEVSRWIRIAFMRRVCKLAIDFAMKEGSVIHFNTFSDFLQEKRTVTIDAAKQEGYHPFTLSELKKINRVIAIIINRSICIILIPMI